MFSFDTNSCGVHFTFTYFLLCSFHLDISSCFAVKQHIFIFHQIFSSLNLIVCGSPPGNLSEVRSPYTNVSHFGFLKDNLHYQPKNHYSLEPIFYCLSFSLFFLCLVVLGFFNFVLFYFVTALCPYLSFSFFSSFVPF